MRLLVLAVLFGFLTSHAIAQTKSSKLVITVDVATNKVTVTDDKGNEVKPVDAAKLIGNPQYYGYKGVITYYKTNPRCCVCYEYMGSCYPVCWDAPSCPP
jgi:hypothetical protein